jgi:hypothetical protein
MFYVLWNLLKRLTNETNKQFLQPDLWVYSDDSSSNFQRSGVVFTLLTARWIETRLDAHMLIPGITQLNVPKRCIIGLLIRFAVGK